jgi:hypothetical protein
MLFLAAAGGGLASAEARAADAGLLHLRCTNAVGGANWPVVVDLDKGFVDSLPATISQSEIEWRDAKGGIYELERATGNLLLRGASSTGGFFLHYNCKPE